jgi:GNAT superfamily N-acetyltransferase
MHIREAGAEDNDELQELQAKCPVGRTLIVSTVNAPDFFARAKAYESYKVFVACEGDRIIGSAACAMRNGVLGGEIRRVGYHFQAFVSPEHQRQGVGTLLHRHIEDYLASEGVALSYLVVMEGNLPPMRLVEGQGFALHRTLVMAGLAVYEEMDASSTGSIRPAVPQDSRAVAELLNQTWEGYDLYEPSSVEGLARFVERTPAYGFDNVLLLEDQGRLLACLGFWDWSQITRITVIEPSLRMRMLGLLIGAASRLRAMPRPPKAGDILRQMVLTPIGFVDVGDLGVLMGHVNNHALESGIGSIFCVCERDHPLLSSMTGFRRIDTAFHLYVKPLQPDVLLSETPVFVDGIDL